MRTPAFLKSITFATLLALASCTTTTTSIRRLEPSRVQQVVVDMNSRGINHFTPFWCSAWLAASGLGIGTGRTAHAVPCSEPGWATRTNITSPGV